MRKKIRSHTHIHTYIPGRRQLQQWSRMTGASGCKVSIRSISGRSSGPARKDSPILSSAAAIVSTQSACASGVGESVLRIYGCTCTEHGLVARGVHPPPVSRGNASTRYPTSDSKAAQSFGSQSPHGLLGRTQAHIADGRNHACSTVNVGVGANEVKNVGVIQSVCLAAAVLGFIHWT